MTLTDKFKSFCSNLDRPETANNCSQSANVSIPVKLYNIFKRSLPVGKNALVFQNVTEEDVNLLFKSVLRPKIRGDQPVIYWDAILVGCADEWNVYSNEGVSITTEEGRDSEANINTYREGTKKDVDWKD